MSAAPTLADIRGRVAVARVLAEEPLHKQSARAYRNGLRDVLDLLDLYVGHEPTIAEELAYRSTELDRLQGIEDRIRAMRTELVDGLHPDLIRRHALVRRLDTILADQQAEAGETA